MRSKAFTASKQQFQAEISRMPQTELVLLHLTRVQVAGDCVLRPGLTAHSAHGILVLVEHGR
eukprot:12793336-Alexandrium_andersonii.AAC.1